MLYVMAKKCQSSKISSLESSSAQTTLAAGKGSCRPYSSCRGVAVLHWRTPLPQVRVPAPGPRKKHFAACLARLASQISGWGWHRPRAKVQHSRPGYGEGVKALCVCVCIHLCVCAREHPQGREGLQHGRMEGQSWASSLLPSFSSALCLEKPYLN